MVSLQRRESTIKSVDTNLDGQLAENRAYEFLCQHGLTIVERNYHCKCGEIDLIMRDQDFYVFTEVRLRRHAGYGNSIESITRHKQRKVIRAAEYYLLINNLTNKVPCRFDAIGIDAEERITWLKNAFQK